MQATSVAAILQLQIAVYILVQVTPACITLTDNLSDLSNQSIKRHSYIKLFSLQSVM